MVLREVGVWIWEYGRHHSLPFKINQGKYISRVTDPREGQYAVEFRVNPEPEEDNSRRLKEKRVELVAKGKKLHWYKEYWHGFSFKVTEVLSDPEHEPNGDPDRGPYKIVYQQHASPNDATINKKGAGPNTFTIEAYQNKLTIYTSTNEDYIDIPGGNATGNTDRTDVPYEIGEWQDVVMHFRLAPDQSGYWEVWINEEPVSIAGQTGRYHGVTTYLRDKENLRKEYQHIQFWELSWT